MSTSAPRSAALYRMVMPTHICPFGLKARDLLRSRGYRVEDHWLTDRDATDTFKAKYQVETTPQVFIDGKRIGGYDALRRCFGLVWSATLGVVPDCRDSSSPSPDRMCPSY